MSLLAEAGTNRRIQFSAKDVLKVHPAFLSQFFSAIQFATLPFIAEFIAELVRLAITTMTLIFLFQ